MPTRFQLFKHCSAAINSGFIWSLRVPNISPSSLKALSQSVADAGVVSTLIANSESTGYSYHSHFLRALFTVAFYLIAVLANSQRLLRDYNSIKISIQIKQSNAYGLFVDKSNVKQHDSRSSFLTRQEVSCWTHIIVTYCTTWAVSTSQYVEVAIQW